MLGARPFALAEDPLLRSTTDRLAAQLQIAPPKLQLIDDALPARVRRRTWAARRDARRQRRSPDGAPPPRELEAVIAHELAHVRTRDVLTQTYAVLLSTTLLELSRIGGFLSRFLLSVLAPIGAAFTHLLLSPKRELAPTRIAAGLVDPHDLADALIRLDRAAELVEFHASPATEPLYTVSPFDHDRARGAHVRHAPAGRRTGLAAAGDSPTNVARADGRGRRPAAAGRPTSARATTKGRLAAALRQENRRHPTLPGACAPSTIGASGLDFSVRNGKRYFPVAMTAEVSRARRRLGRAGLALTLKTP